MKRKFLAIFMSILLVFSSLFTLNGCKGDETFTVTFSPGEYANATLAEGFTEEHLVQTVKNAKDLILPVFVCDDAYHVGWSDIPSSITKDTTLVAVWYKKDFIVKFEPGAVDAVLVSGVEEIVTNTPKDIEPPIYSRKGYTMDPTWGGYNFSLINGNVTVTAKWIPNEYKIYFNETDGTKLNFDENQNVKEDENGKQFVEVKYQQPIGYLPTPTKEGKNFGAWKLPNVTTKVFSDSFYHFDYDITLEPVWIGKQEYMITYNNVDTTDNPISYSIGDSFVLNNPVRKGYEFLGWTYSGQTQPTLFAKISKDDIGDREFTANWQAKTYTVELNALENADVTNKYLQVTFGQKIENLPTPIREGFEFIGWSTNNGTIIGNNTIWDIDDTSIVLTAVYDRLYTIKFVLKTKILKNEPEVIGEMVKDSVFDSLGLTKSQTEEHVWLLENVKENTPLPTLPKAKAVSVSLNGEPYYFSAWYYIKDNNGKKVKKLINSGYMVNESIFTGSYESGVIELLAFWHKEYSN